MSDCLSDKILEAFSYSQECYEPDMKGRDWESPTWYLARSVKGLDWMPTSGLAALEIVEGEMSELEIEWTMFKGIDSDVDGQADFVKCYDSVRVPIGSSPLTEALRRVDVKGTTIQPKPTGCKFPMYLRFLAMCSELPGIAGGTFYLPCRAVGEALGCCATTASTFRGFAEKEGFISKVKEHPRLTRKADEFDWIEGRQESTRPDCDHDNPPF